MVLCVLLFLAGIQVHANVHMVVDPGDPHDLPSLFITGQLALGLIAAAGALFGATSGPAGRRFVSSLCRRRARIADRSHVARAPPGQPLIFIPHPAV